jgi:hypothetical protein
VQLVQDAQEAALEPVGLRTLRLADQALLYLQLIQHILEAGVGLHPGSLSLSLLARAQLGCFQLLLSPLRHGQAGLCSRRKLLLRHLSRLPHSYQALADFIKGRPQLLSLVLQLLSTLSS